jgi:hypothetical protein
MRKMFAFEERAAGLAAAGAAMATLIGCSFAQGPAIFGPG